MERAVAAAQAELIASQCATHVDARAVWMSRCDAHVVAWQAQPKPRPSSPPQSRAYERAKTARRRARRIGRTVPWSTIGDTLRVYERAVALEAETGEEWHVDHIYPLRGRTVSGLHVPANLRAVPRWLNEAKKNLFVEESP